MEGLRKRLGNATRQGGRGRLVGILLVLLAAGWVLYRDAPRTAHVSYRLPPDLAGLSIEYRRDGDTVRRVAYHWPEGGPERLRHDPELAPGPYRVSATLEDPDGRARVVERRIEVERDGLTRVDLR